MGHTFGQEPVDVEVRALLLALRAGEPMAETPRVDFKEERGRRDKSGAVGPSNPTNEAAARELAAEAACMANTPGGGALICGVANSGEVIGTQLDTDWLRHRMWELTDRRLTVDITEDDIGGRRILVIRCPQAMEPIRVHGRVTWRVGTHCVEVDPTSWHAKRMATLNYDWSAEESNVPASRASAAAVEQARVFLRESREEHAQELAAAPDAELLRRLNVVTGEGMLTNAGVLAFVGRGDPALDYLRKSVTGGETSTRVRRGQRSLLQELAEVFQALEGNNALLHLHREGLVVGQLREIPPLAAREAIVNGVAHREWGSADPTLIEHVGRTLRITSPGGFVGGVNEHNILTHPSKSRNRSLTELLAALRIAEREGQGVDRMVREMIAVGHEPPAIREVVGPYVQAALVGDNVDIAWMAWLTEVLPEEHRRDLHCLLVLRRVVREGWADVATVAPLIQLTVEEARGAIKVVAGLRHAGVPLIERVSGVPAGAEETWRLSTPAKVALDRLDEAQGRRRAWPSRPMIAAGYAAARGRISSTELASIVDAHASNVGGVLKALEDEGVVTPSRDNRRGKGFFYRYVGGDR